MYITTNQTYNYNMMQSFFYIFTGAYIKNGKARKNIARSGMERWPIQQEKN